MAKKLVSKEKVVTEYRLLMSKYHSNSLHLKELQEKQKRLQKSISDLDLKIKQQENKLKELQQRYPNILNGQS